MVRKGFMRSAKELGKTLRSGFAQAALLYPILRSSWPAFLLPFLLLLLLAPAALAQSLNPPELFCATNSLSGDVTLTWTPSVNPCGPFEGYEIWASNTPEGPYSLLTTIPAEATATFTHVGADGVTSTWYYYLVPDYDCPGFAAPTSDTLDNRDPAPPTIDFVTVSPAGAELHWLPSPSPETTAYIIYRQVVGFTPLDTVYGRFNTVYTDLTAAVTAQPETYSIAALDSCRTLGLFANPAHTTMLLQEELDLCGTWNLSWNPYAEWPGGVVSHDIVTSVNGAPETVAGSLPGNLFAYNLAVNDGDSVCVSVHAQRGDGVFSRSNTHCRRIRKVQPSRFVYLRNATMAASDSAVIEWYPDPLADGESWRIERGNSPGPWSIRGSGNFPVPATGFFTFSDLATEAGLYYRAQIEDSCAALLPSGAARTIRLRSEASFGLTNNLTWNAFELPGATVQGYDLFRLDAGLWTLLVSLPASALSYVDDVSAFLSGEGVFCYRLEARFDLSLPDLSLAESLISLSNETCAEQSGKVFVPNAIVPGGANPVFKPVLLFAETGSYSLQVISRYGSIIFESADPEQGWDGTIDGEPAPGGSYGYILRFTAVNGQEILKKGNVTVVK
jgi:hypothetical protein